jgi:hypothetical protein
LAGFADVFCDVFCFALGGILELLERCCVPIAV